MFSSTPFLFLDDASGGSRAAAEGLGAGRLRPPARPLELGLCWVYDCICMSAPHRFVSSATVFRSEYRAGDLRRPRRALQEKQSRQRVGDKRRARRRRLWRAL